MAGDGKQAGGIVYGPRLSRRESLRWLGLMLAGGAFTAQRAAGAVPSAADDSGHWPSLELPPVTAGAYGTDPDLVTPERAPWPTTLKDNELATVAILADILVPREGNVPSAGELRVHDVVDEWVSAPYGPQQEDRLVVLSLLAWLDAEAERRFDRDFGAIGAEDRLAIVDDIAWRDASEGFRRPAAAFDRLRSVVLSAFYCTPEGRAELGYLGGQAIAGDYPGPTPAAERHLEEALAALDLEPYAAPKA